VPLLVAEDSLLSIAFVLKKIRITGVPILSTYQKVLHTINLFHRMSACQGKKLSNSGSCSSAEARASEEVEKRGVTAPVSA
jgi:hypothetical protein